MFSKLKKFKHFFEKIHNLIYFFHAKSEKITSYITNMVYSTIVAISAFQSRGDYLPCIIFNKNFVNLISSLIEFFFFFFFFFFKWRLV